MATRHTTVRLEESLLRRLKSYASRHGLTLTAVFERAVETYIATPPTPGPRPARWELPSHGHGGLRPGVDLTDNAAVRALLDAEDGYFSSM